MKNISGRVKERYAYSLILLRQLVVTDFKLRYQGSALGYVWSLLRPLFLFVILYVVFDHFLKFGANIPYYPVYLLLGVVFWSYFTEVTNQGITSIVSKGDLLRKLNFPKYVIIFAGSFSAFINLMINFGVIALFMIINGVELRIEALVIIPLVLELFLLSLGVTFLLSAAFVKLRDLHYVWEIILQAAFYATPILYPLGLVLERSELAAKLIILNPIAQIIQDAREVLITDQTLTFEDLFSTGWFRLIPIIFTLLLVVASALYFRSQSPKFAEDI